MKSTPKIVSVAALNAVLLTAVFISTLAFAQSGVWSTKASMLPTKEALSLAQAPTCVAPPANMVSWWPGDGDANDIQNGNDGTLQGGASFAPGEVGQAFSFNGNSQYVAVPDAENLRFTDAITIDLWINPSAPTQTYGAGIVAKTAYGYGDYAIDFVNGDLRFFFYDGTPQAYAVSAPGWLTPAKVGVWSHIAATYDSSTGTLNLYDGGVVIASANAPANTHMGTNNHELSIGSRQLTGSGTYDLSFAGLADEVEIFNRALSQQEIQSIFNAGSAGKCKVTPTPTPTPEPTPTPTPEPTPTPTPTPQVGPPTNKDQCKNSGWQTFNTPRTFKNQGDCIQFVNTGK